MSENNEQNGTVTSSSIINQVIEAVIDLIDALKLYTSISRGALGTGDSLCCEVASSSPDYIWLDKPLRFGIRVAELLA